MTMDIQVYYGGQHAISGLTKLINENISNENQAVYEEVKLGTSLLLLGLLPNEEQWLRTLDKRLVCIAPGIMSLLGAGITVYLSPDCDTSYITKGFFDGAKDGLIYYSASSCIMNKITTVAIETIFK